METIDYERLLRYLTDLHQRESNAIFGCGPAPPKSAPAVLEEILEKMESGRLDPPTMSGILLLPGEDGKRYFAAEE
jgi:hypothetical protein